jgi:hypothetical protein
MTYSILQVSPEAYREVRQRIVAIDESIGGTAYQRDMIMAGKPERILLTGVAIEALPEEHQVGGMSIPVVGAATMSLGEPDGPATPRVDYWRARALATEKPAPVDDLSPETLEEDARALFTAIAAMHPDLEPPSWDSVEKETKAIYVVGARAVRRRCAPWTLDDWKPSKETINALPQPLRGYIMDLETICDPAGEVLTHHQVRQQAAGVEAMYLAEKKDAERFRALMRCGRIKMQGSSGVDARTGDRTEHNVHFGAEFWPEPLPESYRLEHPESAANYDQSTKWGRACLLHLADEILAQEAGGGTPAAEA